MTGLTLPATLSPALPGKAVAPSLLAFGAPADGASGVPSLAAFIDLMIGKTAIAPKDEQAGEERQDDAAPGKILPEKTDEKGDPALAWLLAVAPIVLPPAQPAKAADADGQRPMSMAAIDATPPALPITGAAATADMPVLPSLPQMATDSPRPPVGGDPVTLPKAADGPLVAARPAAPPDGAPAAVQPVAPTVVPIASAPIALAPIALAPISVAPVADQVMPAAAGPVGPAKPPSPGRPAPARLAAVVPIRVAMPTAGPPSLAASASANAPLPALFALAMAPERDSANDTDKAPIDGIAAAATLLTPADAAALVAKPGGPQGQALDMGRQDWPQKMIDRIEALRDDANANDTSIRLKPEALGRVDVSLRTHADGAVSVHFAAEQSATRTMIADAAPQLNAAAEARGIRLAGTSVDLSGSDTAGGERQRPQFEAQQNNSNRLSAAGGDDIQAVADGRIA